MSGAARSGTYSLPARERRRARAVVIAHQDPCVRMQLATRLIDGRPVLMTNGMRGLLRHLHEVVERQARLPAAVLLGPLELAAVQAHELWRRVERVGLIFVVVSGDGAPIPGVHVVSEPPREGELSRLLAA